MVRFRSNLDMIIQLFQVRVQTISHINQDSNFNSFRSRNICIGCELSDLDVEHKHRHGKKPSGYSQKRSPSAETGISNPESEP